jgi:hypothetical protein
MFGSAVLEVAIGVIFVFLLVSILCSAVREGIEAFLKTRAAYLERGIRKLLLDPNGQGLARDVYTHPLVAGMYKDEYEAKEHSPRRWPLARGHDLPSYIAPRHFALALLDIAARGPIGTDAEATAHAPPLSLASIRANLATLPPEVQRVVLTAVDLAEGDLNAARETIETWYDDAMDRVSSWYKRSTQGILFVIGLVFAVAANIDTVTITRFLSHDAAAREAIVARAQAAVADTGYLHRSYEDAKKDLAALQLPIGWATPDSTTLAHRTWPQPSRSEQILGWLITALAVTMGAPFWFDLLNKVTAIRSAVKPDAKKSSDTSDVPTSSVAVLDDTRAGAPRALAMPAAPAASPAVPAPPDENHVDGCDVAIMSATPDDKLPQAEGGVG